MPIELIFCVQALHCPKYKQTYHAVNIKIINLIDVNQRKKKCTFLGFYLLMDLARMLTNKTYTTPLNCGNQKKPNDKSKKKNYPWFKKYACSLLDSRSHISILIQFKNRQFKDSRPLKCKLAALSTVKKKWVVIIQHKNSKT